MWGGLILGFVWLILPVLGSLLLIVLLLGFSIVWWFDSYLSVIMVWCVSFIVCVCYVGFAGLLACLVVINSVVDSCLTHFTLSLLFDGLLDVGVLIVIGLGGVAILLLLLWV